MTILGVDLSSNQGSFNFQTAWNQGVRACYIKLGGDNIARYESGVYAARVDAAHAVGMKVGSYWLTGKHDAGAAADFFAAHLHSFGAPDFVVLDNEALDSGNIYNDHEAATWVNEVHAHIGGDPRRILHYANTSLMNSHAWPELLATGCSFLIANYNGTPFGGSFAPHTIPLNRIVGHQYADNGNIGGWSPVDLNAFTDTAFNYNQEDSLSAAEVAEIKAYINSQTQYLAEIVRRESRMRLYQNTATKQFMVASIQSGRYEILGGQSELDSLVANGYLEIAVGDSKKPQQVDQTRWNNIIAKCPVNIKAKPGATS